MTRIQLLALTTLCLLLPSACSLMGNIDDLDLPDVIPAETLIQDPTSAANAVRGLYSVNRSRDIGAFTGDLELRSGLLSNWYYKSTTGLKENRVRPTLNILEDYYVAEYKVINQANSIISQLEKNPNITGLSKELRDHYMGVALFFRAKSHLNLLRTFGQFYDRNSPYGICYIDFPPRKDADKIARHSVSEVFDRLYADLDKAEQLTAKRPAEGSEVGGQVYRDAVLALKARTLLADSKYPEAIAAAEKAIAAATEGGLILEPDYLDAFRKRSASRENLFSLNATYPEGSMHHDQLHSLTPRVPQMAAWLVPDPSFVQPLFDGNEPIYLMTFGSEYLAQEGTLVTGTNKKYPSSYTIGGEQMPYIGIRLAELYYIAAEAYAAMDMPLKSIDALTPVLHRAGYTDNYFSYLQAHPDELRLRIMYHKHIEFLTENPEPCFDDIRLQAHKVVDLVALRLWANSDHLELPIPRAAEAGNSLLKQNPGYTK